MSPEEMVKLMTDYHITIREAAAATGISERNVRYCRTGEKHVPDDVAEKLLALAKVKRI